MDYSEQQRANPESQRFIESYTLAEIGEGWPHYKEGSLLEDGV